MKKNILFGGMLLLAAAFTGCSEDFKDWANPITNPQPEAITIPGVSASAAATNIDLGKAEESVKLITLSTATFPEGTTLDKMRIVLTPTDVEEAESKILQAISTTEGTFSKEALQEIIVSYYGKRPDVRSFDAQVYLDGIYNGQAAYIDAGTVNLTLIPEAPYIAQNYYLVGGNGAWGNDKSQQMSHSDKDVFEDPIFTYVLTGGSELWFAFGDADALDAIDTGDWKQLFGTTGASEDLSGSFDRRYNLDGDHSFHVDGSAKFYRFTINALEMTYEITPLNFDPYIYFIGATDGWANAEQKLALTDESGIYTGYLYCADPNGWGNEFKFQKEPGNWDSQVNADMMTGGITGDFIAGGGGNFKANAGESVYYVTLNMADMSISGVKVDKMGIIGDFNGWGTDLEMTWNANDYCYEVTGATVNANGWKFRVNGDWGINLGGNDSVEPSTVIDDLVANGKNLGVVGATIKLYPTRKTTDKIYCTVE